MATMTHDVYRQPLFSIGDTLFRRCLTGASIAGSLFLIAVLLAPARQHVITRVEQLPERFARLIIEKPEPKPAAPGPEARPTQPQQEEAAAPAAPAATPAATPAPQAAPRVRRLEAARERPADAGAQGRQRAQQATASVQQATRAIDRSLAGVSTSLKSTTTDAGRPSRRRAREVRAGRSGGEVGAVDARVAGAAADLGGSAVEGSRSAA
jgi:outer membrane biosynthesis protein TonB